MTRALSSTLLRTLCACILLLLGSCGGSSAGVVDPPAEEDVTDGDEEVLEEEEEEEETEEEEGDEDEEDEPDPFEDVRLLRDTFGVPHVYAESDAGAFFGLGYAMAEDRLFQMHWLRLLARGRSAEFFGVGEEDGFLANDREMRLTGLPQIAEVLVSNLAEEERQFLRAFARGVDQYAFSDDVVQHPFFADFGVPIESWTAADSALVFLFGAKRFGPSPFKEVADWKIFEQILDLSGGDEQAAIDFFTDPGPVDDPAAVVQESDVDPDWLQAVSDFADSLGLPLTADATAPPFHFPSQAPKFSHAWTVAGTRSSTGGALLYGDPRSQIFLPSFFYEWHAVGATFDARGVSMPGSVNLLAGTTQDVAWSLTSLGADQADLFVLKTDAAAYPDKYRLDGLWVDFTNQRPETIQILGDAPETVTYRESHFGPDVSLLVEEAEPDQVFALRATFLDPSEIDSFRGFLAMMRAADVHEFGVAIEGWRNPAANVVFGDRAGSIGYWCKGPIPVRSTLSPLGGSIVQDGSSVTFDWLALVPHDLLPNVVNPAAGHILSANHAPAGAWYPIPLSLSTGGKGDTQRSRRLRERIEAQIVFTPEELADIHNDTVNVSRRDVAAIGLALRAQPGYPPPCVDEAILELAFAELKPWVDLGAPMTTQHHASALARFIIPILRDTGADFCNPGEVLVPIWGGGENGLQLFLKALLEKIETGAVIELEEAQWVLQRIEEAWLKVELEIGTDTAAWIPWFEDEMLTFEFPQWGTLVPVPTLVGDTVLVEGLTCTDGGTLMSLLGQAFSFSAAFGATEQNVSMMPFGQSEHAGPHEFDQKTLLETDVFKAAPIAEVDVQAMVVSEVLLEFEP